MRDYEIVFKGKGDYETVAGIVREAAVFLYLQWFQLSKERYSRLVPLKQAQ